jgi:hypothetical protein
METEDLNKELYGEKTGTGQEPALPGYPASPKGEDVYNKLKEEKSLDPEDPSKIKAPIAKDGGDKNYYDDMSGSDLDIPGSELDDLQEKIGSEDEENNLYSLGGDDHNDLDEDTGGV